MLFHFNNAKQLENRELYVHAAKDMTPYFLYIPAPGHRYATSSIYICRSNE